MSENLVVLVTGAGSGIGRAAAVELARAGSSCTPSTPTRCPGCGRTGPCSRSCEFLGSIQ